jgi:hypothetical protein
VLHHLCTTCAVFVVILCHMSSVCCDLICEGQAWPSLARGCACGTGGASRLPKGYHCGLGSVQSLQLVCSQGLTTQVTDVLIQQYRVHCSMALLMFGVYHCAERCTAWADVFCLVWCVTHAPVSAVPAHRAAALRAPGWSMSAASASIVVAVKACSVAEGVHARPLPAHKPCCTRRIAAWYGPQ